MTHRYLSTQELTQLRADQADYMPDTWNVLRGTAAANSVGEWELSWGTVAGTIAGRLRPAGLSPSIVTPGGQIQTEETWYFYIDHSGTLLPGDRVVGVSTAGTFEVIQPYKVESWPTAVKAQVKRLEA